MERSSGICCTQRYDPVIEYAKGVALKDIIRKFAVKEKVTKMEITLCTLNEALLISFSNPHIWIFFPAPIN